MKQLYKNPEYCLIIPAEADILTESPNSDAGNDELPIIPIGNVGSL